MAGETWLAAAFIRRVDNNLNCVEVCWGFGGFVICDGLLWNRFNCFRKFSSWPLTQWFDLTLTGSSFRSRELKISCGCFYSRSWGVGNRTEINIIRNKAGSVSSKSNCKLLGGTGSVKT